MTHEPNALIGLCEGLTHTDGYCDGCGNTPCKDETARMKVFEATRHPVQQAPACDGLRDNKCECGNCNQLKTGCLPDDGTRNVPKRWCYANRFVYGEGGMAKGLKAVCANISIAHAIVLGMNATANPSQSSKDLVDKIFGYIWQEIGKDIAEFFDGKDRKYIAEMVENHVQSLTQPAASEPSAEAEKLANSLLPDDMCADDSWLKPNEEGGFGFYRKMFLLQATAKIVTALHAARLEGAKSQWQPIETAPKDGTDILVSGGKVRWEDGDENEMDEGAVRLTFWHNGKWIGGDEKSLGQSYWFSPTHWMPLPAAPEQVIKETK